jgi:hypothetical protein
MLRQILLLLAGLFAFVGLTVLATTPETVAAENLSRNAIFFLGFIALAVGVPVALNLYAHHRLPKGATLPAVVKDNTRLEIAVLLMFGSVALIASLPLQGASPPAFFLAIAIGTVGVAIASLEHLWYYFVGENVKRRPKRKTY